MTNFKKPNPETKDGILLAKINELIAKECLEMDLSERLNLCCGLVTVGIANAVIDTAKAVETDIHRRDEDMDIIGTVNFTLKQFSEAIETVIDMALDDASISELSHLMASALIVIERLPISSDQRKDN